MILVLAPAVVVVVTNISIGSIGSMMIKDSVGFDEFVIHCLMIDVPLFVLAVCLVLSVSNVIKDRSNDY